MVTKFVPLPDNDGGKQRALAVARRLARGSDLVLCAYDDGTADSAALADEGIDVRSVAWRPTPVRAASGAARTRSISAGRFYSAALADEVRRAAARGPARPPARSSTSRWSRCVPASAPAAASWTCTTWSRPWCAATPIARRGPSAALFHLEAAALRAMERTVVPGFDTVVVVSEQRAPAPARRGPRRAGLPERPRPRPPRAARRRRPRRRWPSWPPWAGPRTWTPPCGSGASVWPGVLAALPRRPACCWWAGTPPPP